MSAIDVLIIGAGPGGSTAANLLASQGIRTVLLDKETHPRFHIGESLLPIDAPIFKRLGVDLDRVGFLVKGGADFYDEATGQFTRFDFADALPGSPTKAWQVDRSQFDALLAHRAAEVGAQLREGQKVVKVELGADAVQAWTKEGEHFTARFLVDATGQDALLARKHESQASFDGFGRAAVFCHFEGLSAEAERRLYDTGHIKIVMIPQGWCWLIPLAGGRLSVGLVSREKGLGPERLAQFIAESPLVQGLTAGAHRTEARVIRNFSFKNLKPHGPRWACIGDASCFLDPVFSSGVSLAMCGGAMLADILGPALRENREAQPDLMAPLAVHMDPAYKSFAALIHRFYHTKIVHNLFFDPAPDAQFRQGITSVLACDVWRDDNPFQAMLLTATRHKADF